MGFQIVRLEHSMLQNARGRLGLTQRQAADAASIQLRQYQRFESGERSLSSSSFRIARRVLDALELDLSSFARGDYMLSSEEEGGALLREYFSKSDAFKDRLCLFIGRLERCSKREAQELLFAAGGVPQNNIAAYVSFVVAGKGAEGTKAYAEAERYKRNGLLSILTEQEFFDILDGKATPPEKPGPDLEIIINKARKSPEDDFADLIERKRAGYIASGRFVLAAGDIKNQ